MTHSQIDGYKIQIYRAIVNTGRFDFDFKTATTYHFAVVRDLYRKGIIDRAFRDFGEVITWERGDNFWSK